MIKVLINGTPIYRLEFRRRKYKTLKKKGVTAGEILARVQRDWKRKLGIDPSSELEFSDVHNSIQAAFEKKALYETTALIFIIDAKHDEPPVATASSRQWKQDDNNKLVGRGHALTKLLHLNRDGTPVFTDIEREAIRKAYNDRAKHTSKPTPPVGSAGSTPIAQVRKPATAVGKVLDFTQRPSLSLAA